MHDLHRSRRYGFTLVEVMTAVVLLSVALLAMTASAAFAIRHVANAERELRIMAIVERNAERARGTSCHDDAGVDSVAGATVIWAASSAAGETSLQQTAQLTPRPATRLEQFVFVERCH